jgi:hypothetical protein
VEYGRRSLDPLLRGTPSGLVEAVVFDQREILGIPNMDDELDLCFRLGVFSWLWDSRNALGGCGGVSCGKELLRRTSCVGVVIRSYSRTGLPAQHTLHHPLQLC